MIFFHVIITGGIDSYNYPILVFGLVYRLVWTKIKYSTETLLFAFEFQNNLG